MKKCLFFISTLFICNLAFAMNNDCNSIQINSDTSKVKFYAPETTLLEGLGWTNIDSKGVIADGADKGASLIVVAAPIDNPTWKLHFEISQPYCDPKTNTIPGNDIQVWLDDASNHHDVQLVNNAKSNVPQVITVDQQGVGKTLSILTIRDLTPLFSKLPSANKKTR